MPTLAQSLPANDPAFLRIVAELWGLELDTEPDVENLNGSLLDPRLVREIWETLPPEARRALHTLIEAGGRLPWPVFARRFGEIREVGPGRRDRQKIYLQPASAAETLHYRALLARAFFDTPSGPQEFAYLPDDLLEILRQTGLGEPSSGIKNSILVGRPASPREREHILPASDRILDDLTTLLAALRLGIQPPHTGTWCCPAAVLLALLEAANLISGDVLQTEAVRTFLESPRAQALHQVARAWQESETFNELHLLPGLICEGEWKNTPLAARQTLLTLLEAIPREQWWSLPAFVRAVKETYPDFQRPAGDYDSWFIKRAADGTYLRGFEHWDEVDGALVRYIITGPLYWLGMADLAAPAEGETITAFRLGPRLSAPSEGGRLNVSSQGRITVMRPFPRAVRYQIARFCEWEEEKPDEYRYLVTTRSLQRAQEQGLKVSQLLSLLAKHASAELPPAFVKALKRWEASGTEARVETHTILRVTSPEVLTELRKSRAGRFLGEPLGPTVVIVKDRAVPQVLAALAEMGLLAEASVRSDIIAHDSNHE